MLFVQAIQVPFLEQPKTDILHITDIHLDLHYKTGGSFASQCHDVSKHKDALPLGSPESPCDAPLSLVEKTFDSFKTLNPQVVVWTGDNARKMVKSTFPSAVIVPSIGNNDVHPHNSLSFGKHNLMLDFYGALWQDMIPDDQASTFQKIGCFYKRVNPKLIVASVNTMYLFQSNSRVKDCSSKKRKPKQAGDYVLDWLEHQVLEPGRLSGASVYLTGHIPPSIVNYKQDCYSRIAHLFVKYRDVIQGQFYGHMNLDHFFFPTPDQDISKTMDTFSPSWVYHYFSSLLRHYGKSKKSHKLPYPVLVAPSVVPAFNPSYRVYHLDPKEYKIQTYIQYYMPLSDKHPKFKIEYTQTPDSAKTMTTKEWQTYGKHLSASTNRHTKTRKQYFKNLVVGRENHAMPH
ncbi:Metallo-dependent phosphatase-like protein [Gorgonomyces haynaldii]|nr:Metallo-dependent phosphatase-like protein [Gorgonomyces haynaldii]